ncbi:hypothetical protein Srot_1420 [Segniliparus rotundus DSM 44985]|uniref:Uncharacterized protein n=1 Tax=Segniliparus rotundus (strain ATCC BAA-972 / CDC 1076 / CIP 108378 / DSM 44985 / JCM 13578) TaxID=640132 RepID=D6Z7F4_SEGRD|nr:hypothetical protein [Segniliparus rotundus]ADG97884.1 hypothetical protein Srot_1420 [Segniliparus rotundus DSM 44985]
MSEKNYMADPASDFVENLQIGGSLQPDVVSAAIVKRVQTTGAKLGEITQTLSSRVGMRHWVGKSGDVTRDELEDLARKGKTAAEVIDGHAKQVQAVAESQATAKSVCDQNSQCTPGTSPMAQVKAVARAMQNHYHEPGEPEYPKLEYLGSPPGAPTEDRGESPDGPSEAQPRPSSGSGAPSLAGGAAEHESAAKPQSQEDAASGQQPEAKSEGKPSGESAGAGGGSGGGAGSGDGGKGAGAGAGGGAPSGGSPAAGTSSPGSGFNPSESSSTHAMSAGDSKFGSSSSGSSGLGGGGVGTLGGDHERSLSAKTGPAGYAAPKPVVNVNGLAGSGVGQGAGMGGGMGGMGGAAGGQNSGKEHKTPDYLKDTEHGNELFGRNLPVVIPEVIGELNRDEQQKMLEALAKQQGGGPGGA